MKVKPITMIRYHYTKLMKVKPITMIRYHYTKLMKVKHITDVAVIACDCIFLWSSVVVAAAAVFSVVGKILVFLCISYLNFIILI